jgi:hypothetical protein
MFIDPIMIQRLRSSGARCFRRVHDTAVRFAPLERGESFGTARSMNIASLQDEENLSLQLTSPRNRRLE